MRTRGQPSAVRAIRVMAAAGPPHALLLVGPQGVGKTTLALDLAATLLCSAEDPAARPCRSCRACRLVDHGNHPDLHRLAPGGAGDQIKIAATSADPRPGVRELIDALALLPVEGGARVAIVEAAHRMNEDAQNALLKLLEEPPPGVHLVLCADDEDRLLPTIRSRCARVRLGAVDGRAIEALLVERGLADPPTAALLGRLAGGRPGLAAAYALDPAARTARSEIDRGLIDLLASRPSRRLADGRSLLTRAADLDAALDGTLGDGPRAAATKTARARLAEDQPSRDVPVAQRRRAALALVEAWRVVAIELVRVTLGDAGHVHDATLIEDFVQAAAGVSPRAVAAFLPHLDRAAIAIRGNASPELAVDVLVLAWPRSSERTAA